MNTHVHFLDPYRSGNSPVHRLDPRVKFILALGFILAVSLTPFGAWPVYILLYALAFSIILVSELGVGYVLRRSMLAAPFVLAAFPVMFTIPGIPLLQFSIGPWQLVLSVAGLERFISIALKSWISVQVAIVLAATTTFPELMVAMRAVKVPRLLVAIFGLMWRYLFVLADEVLRLMRARTARSGRSSNPNLKTGGSLVWRARVTGGMAGNLFLRAFERSDRIYMAMVSRGYDGEVRSEPLPVMSSASRLVLVLGIAILVVLLAIGFLVVG